jgi:signal transduction histidine kinase
MKKLTGKNWLLGGVGIASLLIGIVSTISYQNSTRLIESTNKSKQTYEVIKNLVDVFAAMTVMESGRRGYVFWGDPKELFRYHNAVNQIGPDLKTLRQRLDNNLDQRQRLVRLESLLSQRIDLIEQSIALYQREQTVSEQQRIITEKSTQLRDQIQLVINEMQTQEDQLLQEWLKQSQASTNQRIWIEFGVTLFSFTILAVVSILLYRQLARQQEAETAQYNLIKEKELSDLKLRFFSMVSHEFRTPLSIILGSSQLLLEGGQPWPEERKAKNLHRIHSSAQRMTHLLNDILLLTRAEAGKLECDPQPLDVEAFCLNLVEEMQLSMETQQVIVLSSQGHCTHAALDEKLLYSILSNLLSNAVKYSSSDSKIHLRLTCESTATLFQIQDSGVGIAPEDQANLYQPFHRGQNVASIPGTGLGLAVVKKCVDLHRGEIFVHSQVGQGTEFTVRILQ